MKVPVYYSDEFKHFGLMTEEKHVFVKNIFYTMLKSDSGKKRKCKRKD